jgi:hypothetical protein
MVTVDILYGANPRKLSGPTVNLRAVNNNNNYNNNNNGKIVLARN